MDNDAILREEVARGLEATRTKTALQIHFDQRRELLTHALLEAPVERLVEVRAALVALNQLEEFLAELEASGRMASHQLGEADALN